MQQAVHACFHSTLELMTVYSGTQMHFTRKLFGRVGLYDAAGSPLLDTLKRTRVVTYRQLRLVKGVPLIDFGRGKK